MSKKLFFVEYIHNYDEAGVGSQSEVILEEVPQNSQKDNGNGYVFQHIILDNPPVFKDLKRNVEEGHYVYYEDKVFYSAKNDPIANKRRRDNAKFRRQIRKISESRSNTVSIEEGFTDKASVFSYHVNVGHGNCTILLIQEDKRYEVWVVDCGEYDYLKHKSYKDNIEECLKDVAGKIGKPINDIRVSKLMITHWHFDHVSGIEVLINKGIVNTDTILLANMYYSFSSGCVNKLLKKFVKIKIRCYEPVASLASLSSIRILYPSVRLKKFGTWGGGFKIVKKVNNSSVVYSLELAGKRMILPGDLENNGFNTMTSEPYCCPALKECDYYCISHHGSINGHINIQCTSNPAKNVMACCRKKLKHAILMGRDKAYPGIYNPGVQASWGSYLRISESAPHYLLLDWQTDNIYPR